MKNIVVTRILVDGAVPEFQQHDCTSELQHFRARAVALYASIGEADSGQREVVIVAGPGEAEALASMFTRYGLTCRLQPAPEFLDAAGNVNESAIRARLAGTAASPETAVDYPRLDDRVREAAWA